MSVKVQLTPSGQAQARAAGNGRYQRRRASGSEHRWNRGNDHTAEKDVEAVGAEIACAAALGVEWVDDPNPDHDGDLGPGLQVRHTTYVNGRLLLHDSDDPSHTFFLVTGRFPNYMVVGSITGERGRIVGEVRELQPGRPCICVEQSQLDPVAM